MDKSCPKCTSQKILRNVQVVDRNGEYQDMNLSVRVNRNPGALIFKGSITVDLTACICGACGYTEFYAVDPAKLWNAMEQNR
ncbi:MAG TPA: hypothetical protein VFR01_03940 [Geobacterales bacterium]|nr:hypothetical protein [Geobacterales bacterium]